MSSKFEVMIRFYASCLGHFHAYQMMSDKATTSIVAKNILSRSGDVLFMTTDTIINTPAMMFAKRLTLYSNTQDRNTIAIGISNNIPPSNKVCSVT
jgi:hypothetical protein